MITLHRLGHAVDTFQINPDAIITVEATPDTVITIPNGQKIVVAEPPERVAADIEELPGDRARPGVHPPARAACRAQSRPQGHSAAPDPVGAAPARATCRRPDRLTLSTPTRLKFFAQLSI